jgi:hypothetical protein
VAAHALADACVADSLMTKPCVPVSSCVCAYLVARAFCACFRACVRACMGACACVWCCVFAHQVKLQVGLSGAVRLAQCSEARIHLHEHIAAQVRLRFFCAHVGAPVCVLACPGSAVV